MFTKEFFELLKYVLKSWQVIASAVAIFLYLNIVSYVSKSYHRPRVKKIKIKKEKAAPPPAEAKEEGGSPHDSNDELGLEEA